MRGKAQPDGRPALQIIETLFLLLATCDPKYMCNAAFRLASCCSGKIYTIGQYKVAKFRNRILLHAPLWTFQVVKILRTGSSNFGP